MEKRTMRYLSGTFFISTVPTLVGTQQAFAEGGNPATPEQQKEVVDYCYKEVQKYWEVHDSVYTLGRILQTDKLPSYDRTDWIDLEYKKCFEGETFPTK